MNKLQVRQSVPKHLGNDDLDEEDQFKGIEQQINMLKSVTININDEIRSQNLFMEEFRTGMETTTYGIMDPFKNLKRMTKEKRPSYTPYLLVVAAMATIALYIITK